MVADLSGACADDIWMGRACEPFADQIENVPVPPPLELDPLALPDPLPDDEPEVENEDDPLDLLPDDDPLLDQPLVEPDADPLPDSEPEPEPLPEAEPLLDPDEPLTAVWFAGMSL